MKILECDCCHVRVNDRSEWLNTDKPRNMYELKCVHEYHTIDNYAKMILCSECLDKWFFNNISEVDNGENNN